MRILHALSQTELTGSEAYAFDLVTDQQKKSHWTLVVSDHLHLAFPGQTEKISLSTNSFWQRMRNILKLRKLLQAERIDVIHCHSRGACRHLYWASRGLKIPILTTIHGFQHTSFSKRLFNIYGDYILAVCEKIRDQMVLDLRTKSYAIEVLRNPMPFPKHAPARSTTLKPTRILLAGRYSGPKGRRLREVFRFLEPALQKSFPGVELHLVLSGANDIEIAKLRKAHSRAEVLIEGTRKDLRSAVTLAGLSIASGRIALEALSLGSSVLALGEASQQGLVSKENLQSVLSSNFGDVGPEQILDVQSILREVETFIKQDPGLVAEAHAQMMPIIEHEFQFERISDRMIDLYRGLRLFKYQSWLPILMYHKIVPTELQSPHKTFVTTSNFAKHLRYFRWLGLTTLTFNDLADFWFERRPLSELPKKPVLLTFDDGYLNNLENAQPLLLQNQMKAEIFLLADHAITFNTWDPDEKDGSAHLLSFEQKKKLQKSAFSIGSHGLTHRHYPDLTNNEIFSELAQSKQILETDLGQRVNAMAFPFGDLDPRLPALAEKAGYDFAVNTDQGPVYWFTQRYSLFRANIFPSEGLLSLWKKTSTWYREYYFKKRGR